MTTIEEKDYHLFRPGMLLRKYHLVWLFDNPYVQLENPELIEERPGYLYRGTGLLKSQVPKVIDYTTVQLKMGAPDIYQLAQESKPNVKLDTKLIHSFEDHPAGGNQVATGFRSGILKYDTRGYYFDPLGLHYLKNGGK